MTLQQAAIRLAHQKPQLRAALVPMLRQERRRKVFASATHVMAVNSVELLKNNPDLKKDLLQALIKAGVPQKEAIKAFTSITGEKEHELVLAVEQGINKKPRLMKKLGSALWAVIKAFGKTFYWLGKKILQNAAGLSLWVAARLALLAGFAYLLYSFATDPIGSAHTAQDLFTSAKAFLSSVFGKSV